MGCRGNTFCRARPHLPIRERAAEVGSDSRQDAAFFAPYLENTYNRAVRRRLIAQAITKLNERGAPRTDDVLIETRRLAEDALMIDPDAGRLTNETEVGSWLTEEFLGVDRRQGLEGTGTAEIRLAVPRRWEPPGPCSTLASTPGRSPI